MRDRKDCKCLCHRDERVIHFVACCVDMGDDINDLLRRAAKHVMTPEEARAQKLSFIRGQTGRTTEEILKVLPELSP